MLCLVRFTPGRDLLQPVEAIAESCLMRWEGLVTDCETIADALPERADSAFLELGQLSPFEPLNEPDGLEGKQAKRVEHIILGDLSRAAIAIVEPAGSSERSDSSFRRWGVAYKLLDQGACIGVALVRCLRIRELAGLGEQPGDAGDSVGLHWANLGYQTVHKKV